MKFTCKQKDIRNSIGIVEKSVSAKTTLPILENIYMEVLDNTLKMRGNDLEIGIETSIPIENPTQKGTFLVKSKTISSIVSKLNNENIKFEITDKNKVIIQADKLDFDLLGMNSNEYPAFPNIEDGASFQLSVGDLKELIGKTIFSVSFDATKQFLNGILMENDGKNLVFVATDGYRLSLKKIKFESVKEPFSIIAPYKAMNELYRIIQSYSDDKFVSITLSNKQIVFSIDDIVIISRVIEGQFPDYNQVIPKETNNIIQISRKTLIDAADRASIIASGANNVIRLKLSESELEMTANAASLGDYKEALVIQRELGSDEIKVAFNVKLVQDVIKQLECDDIRIELNNALSPCVIKSAVDSDYIYIIMPINTSDYVNLEDVD